MRRILVALIILGFAAGIVFISNNAVLAKDKATKEVKKAEAAPEKPKEEPKVVCKFKNKEEMQNFEQLYVAKQATFGRMGVLQAYFTMEQNNLKEIDKQLEEKFKFKMDTDKMYDLNRETMEIKEVGPVPQQQQQAPAAENK